MFSGNNAGGGSQGMGMFPGGFSSIGQLLGGIFGNSGEPYKKAGKEYEKYFQGATAFQNPFYNSGQQGTNNFQNWLQGQQDPSAFINKLMGQYQESPFAQNLQRQSMRAGTNAASANGLAGSTPFAQQMQQNAGQIASQDQNQWLQNVLGINSQYGQGQQSLMQGGQHASDMLSQLFSQQGSNAAGSAFGQQAGKNQDFMSILAGLFG